MATILIVDDRESNRQVLTTLLGYRNHQTVEADDGAAGLERARAVHPDLIITDILMPTMDGYEFTRRLRQDPALSGIPVIFYSAHYVMQEARALAAQCAVKYVVPKPAEPEELLRAVDAALGLAAGVAAPSPAEDFDREHVRVLTDKLSQKTEELRNLNARLEALIDIGRELNVAQDASYLIQRYCKAAREVIGALCASACITDENGGGTRRLCSSRANGAAETCEGSCSLTGPIARVVAERICQRARNGDGEPVVLGCAPGLTPVDSYLVVPIATRNRIYGWLGLGNKVAYAEFTADDERLLVTLAAQLAMGYENSRLFEQLKHRAEDLEREAAERRQTAERFRTVVEQASDGIAIADERGHYVEVNPKMLEMMGYTRREFLGLDMQNLVAKEDQARDPIPFDELRSGKVVQKERRFLRKDGSLVEMEASMSRLEDGRVLAIVRDVAERKRLEAQLRQSQKLEAVGRLAGGVAHDFNNLLTVILGHSDLALSALEPGDRRRRDIEDVRDAGARAAMLTSQLLAFSRKQVLQPRLLSVNNAVANLTKMLGRLISSNIEVLTRYEPEPWHIKVDPGQLDQVILNLAINARDAMPLGGKLILEVANQRFDASQLARHTEVPPGDYVMLAVSDTGVGMDAETRSHLFEPFFTTKAAGKGTGLGLSTVYGIVRQSGGYIWVYSEPGRGTTVKVYLPRALGATEALEQRDPDQPLPAGSETILLAEDEDRVRSLIVSVLARQGYNVLEARDGQEAMEIARRYPGEIHLLFTDIMMPKMTGNDLADQIRRGRPAIKVLFTSGYTGDAGVQHGVLDPSVPFLSKPFTPRALAVKVREALEGRAASAAALTGTDDRNETDAPGTRYPA